jgi:membrane protein CcdC involved in cytochrome C biogenesis
MTFHYNKTWGIILLAIGLLLSCIFCSFELNGKSSSVVGTPAFIFILFGILYFRRPYFILNDNSLVLCAILGFGNTTYPLNSSKVFEIENNNFYISQNGKRQKINITIGMIDKKEWQAFISKYKES